ncbi:MAG: ATP-binding protein [Bacteroidales bacterium]|jgi:predicted AAA+ superfamily ATPase|nr:ATP-binding protein [Bacteroidales bacterium]
MNDLIKRKYYIRQLEKLCGKHIIKVIVGFKRCGKSTLMEMFAQQLQESGIPPRCVQIYNFEKPWHSKDADWYEIYHYIMEQIEPEYMNYIFLDEPQRINEFERLLDALFAEKNIDLYITGSNASFLSGEIATLLSGRYINIPILPFSFSEYMEVFQKTNPADKYIAFENYLYGTSLPQGTFFRQKEKNLRNRYVQDVFDTVIEKDIFYRYRIRNPQRFDVITKYLMNNIGVLLSSNSISKVMSKDNKKIPYPAIDKYIGYLCDAFLFYPVSRFNIKGEQQLLTREKYYLVDIGFRNAKTGKFLYRDTERILENIVYLELYRRGYQIWAGNFHGHEIDFAVRNEDNTFEYYQVVWSVLNPESRENKLKPLKAIYDDYPKYILSTDMPSTDINGVKHLNVIDWLLND